MSTFSEMSIFQMGKFFSKISNFSSDQQHESWKTYLTEMILSNNFFFKSKYGDPFRVSNLFGKKKIPLSHAYFEATFGATI